MKRTIGVLAASLLVLGLLAGPALAKNEIAVFSGTAEVSKTDAFGVKAGTCTDGVPVGGLGAPLVTGVKKGYWRLDTTLTVLTQNVLIPGTLVACGQLDTVARALMSQVTGNPDAGLGAACGMSKGYDGYGVIKHPGKAGQIDLDEITWKLTVGGTLPVIGDAAWSGTGTSKDSMSGRLIALVQAQGAGPCGDKSTVGPADWFNKQPTKSDDGAVEFTIAGVGVVLQNTAVPAWNAVPGFGKGPNDAIYGEKKK